MVRESGHLAPSSHVQIAQDLCLSTAYAKAEPTKVELRETHISWVFLTKNKVYKVKKPVNFGFLDFSTLEARKLACEAEVRLNRRLAEDVYLGVRPVFQSPLGRYSFLTGGRVADYAVAMQRLPDTARADNKLARGDLSIQEVDALASKIAVFHSECRQDDEVAAFGKPQAIRRNVDENFEQTRATINMCLSKDEVRSLEEWQRRFLDQHETYLMERVQAGFIRDGHGDLRLEHAYWRKGNWTVIDCIEFNDRFRYADTCADVAFMAMDLTAHEHPLLSERFIARYARDSNDFGLYPLLDFYQSYRAFVRGKVALLSADELTGITPSLAERARHYFLVAHAAAHAPLEPARVIAIGGLVASGKSALADRLSLELGCPVVESDRTRKQLFGVAPADSLDQGPWTGAYDEAASDRVYTELFNRAGHVLEARRSVVIDASFRTRKARKQARVLAQAHGVGFLFIECRVPKEIALKRLALRHTQEAVSDAREDLYESFVAAYEPVTELPPDAHMTLATDRTIEDSVSDARARILDE
ncbi:MAG: AAA family ATPase [Myxococcales bacterium]|nr:AAA family ATPase [Myxococcales bacterium]